MNTSLLRRSSAALAVGALASMGLAAAPAQAVIPGNIAGGSAGFTPGTSDGCTVQEAGSAPTNLPLLDNGVPVTQSWSRTATATKDDTPADVIDLVSSGTLTATLTKAANGTTTIAGSASIKTSAVPRQANPACGTSAFGSGGVMVSVELAQPMWMTMTTTGTGTGTVSTLATTPNGSSATSLVGRTDASARVLVPAGKTDLNAALHTSAGNGDVKNRRSEATASFKIVLQPLGDATAPTGKGGGYAQFGARDCATGNVAAAITKKAKKKAKQVVVTVNGAKVAKFKGKKLKKRALVLPAAPASAAEVVATITLKNGKKVTVTRSYLACS